MLLACASRALAVNPTLDVSQYAHTAWKVSDGFVKGITFAIAQTPDGYLWLGTEAGLFRFDGVRAVEWQPPRGERLPSSDIRRLYASRDGRLWLGTFAGLASVKDGRLMRYPALDGQRIDSLLQARDGTIWAAGSKANVGRLCRIQNDTTQCYGEDGRFGTAASALYEDRAGNLWAGGTAYLWRWSPGAPTRYAMPDPANPVNSLLELDDGTMLVSKRTGLTRLRSGKTEAYALPDWLEFTSAGVFRDRDGGLWIGATVDRGLLHVHEGRMDLFSGSDGLSGNSVSQFFEDREGSVWVVTLDGIDRFRDAAVPRMSVRQGLSSQAVASVLATTDGSVWFATNKGLDRVQDGELTNYRKHPRSTGGDIWGSARGAEWSARLRPVREVSVGSLPEAPLESLFEDHVGRIWVTSHSSVAVLESGRVVAVSSMPSGVVFSITEDRSGDVWMSHQEGLFRLRDGRLLERIPWSRFGRTQPAYAIRYDAGHDGFWLGFRDGGVADFRNGQVRAWYGRAEGLPDGWVTWLHLDATSTLWVAAEGGLGRIKDGRASMLTTRNGLPCDRVNWITEDDVNAVWLYTACGLMRVARPELDAWARNPAMHINPTVFDATDGVLGHLLPRGYNPMVSKSRDGRIWFIPVGGVSMIDPAHLPFNALPPPIHIEQIIADGTVYPASSSRQLAPLVRELEIDYTALSFVAPEKNQFRVKLDGRDRDWQEVGTRRQVFYTDLSPGTYHFLVQGSNNSGVWNETGASLEFSIAPAYYQTRWFNALVVATVIAMVWVAYAARVRQVARQYHRRLDERVNERTRIARELHDTLLQSFHGLLLRFQTVLYLLPERPDEARAQLQGAIGDAAKAITEGRDAVQSLRASTVERNDLAVAIRTLGVELAENPTAHQPSTFSVAVEGQPRDLHPIARDEIYKVAAEALRNAFRHAHASRVEVEIHYDKEQFRLRVRDDGRGIDTRVLGGQEIEGHFGLRGMRERAALIGGKVAVWSNAGAGTEVELSNPASAVYASASARSWWSRLFTSKTRAHG
jgi:signal transduction histidine kinase/ligand-binding sensor domain-containing protein